MFQHTVQLSLQPVPVGTIKPQRRWWKHRLARTLACRAYGLTLATILPTLFVFMLAGVAGAHTPPLARYIFTAVLVAWVLAAALLAIAATAETWHRRALVPADPDPAPATPVVHPTDQIVVSAEQMAEIENLLGRRCGTVGGRPVMNTTAAEKADILRMLGVMMVTDSDSQIVKLTKREVLKGTLTRVEQPEPTLTNGQFENLTTQSEVSG